jgi:hypothetical protein
MSMTAIIRSLALAITLSFASQYGKATSVYNFESAFVGESTPFTSLSNGVIATFSSNGPDGEFAIYTSFFGTLSGNVLLNPGPDVSPNTVPYDLRIDFDHDLDQVFLRYALNAPVGTSVALRTLLSGEEVGSTIGIASAVVGSDFPEGSLTWSGGRFNQVILSSTALNLAVDDVSVEIAPEPSAVKMMPILALLLVLRALKIRRVVSHCLRWRDCSKPGHI